MVQHFMFGPGWEQGCKSCSFMADHIDGMLVHLAHRDVTFVAVSRAPLAEIERFRQRMGWQFKWVSSHGSDFNHDFGVSFTADERGERQGRLQLRQQAVPGEEAPGVSVFYKDDAGDGLPHLLDLRARRGGDDGHLQPARPHAQGPRRGRRSTSPWTGCATTTATSRRRDDEAAPPWHPGARPTACRCWPRPPSPSWRCSPPFSAAARSPCSARPRRMRHRSPA